MSQQEFMRPEQDYDATQQIESDYQVHHRELTGEHPAWERHDETSRRHLIGEKLHPQRPQLSRPSPLHILIVSLALILFITLGTFAFKINKLISLFQSIPVQVYYLHPHNNTSSGASLKQSFSVTGSVRLSINDMAAGNIHVHAGDTNQVVVSETLQSENQAFTSNALPLKTAQDGNTLNITINNNPANNDAAGVILDVYTPTDTSVVINADSASVTIDNVSGQIIANTKDGSITATNDRLSNFSSLQSGEGEIHFTGSFNAKGVYLFSSGSGDIDISLPANSSFRLNTTGVSAANIMNSFGGNVIGDHPEATIMIRTQEGSVTLRKS